MTNLFFARPFPTDPEAELYSRELANRHLIDFTTYTYPKYIVDPFHIKICEILENCIDGDLRRVMIFAPPQHGKSELVSVRLPAFWLGKKPDRPVIICSYGMLLAQNKAMQVRSIIGSHAYRNIFSTAYKDAEEFRSLYGKISYSGIGGAITGFGAGLGIIDDPVKNYEQVLSEGFRHKSWQWYQTTFRTRIWEHGIILLIMTRWHEDDLAGRILNQQGEKWNIFRFPALSEQQETRDLIAEKQGQLKGQPDILGRNPGMALSPSRFSRHELLSTQEEIGPLAWTAEYQGFPQNIGGNMFKEEWFVIIDAPPMGAAKRVRYWDKAATAGGGARSCGVLMSYEAPYWTIEDVVKGQWSTYQREAVIRQVAEQDEEIYGTVDIWIEEEGGSGGIDSAHMTTQNLAGFNVHWDRPTKAKVIRASPFAAQCEAGHVRMVKAHWNKEYLAELLMFPNSTFADQTDGTSGAFLKLTRRGWARGAGGTQ